MPTCRSCAAALHDVVIDLGSSPLANSYLSPERLAGMEPFFPLTVYFCRQCGLVQLEECASPEAIFRQYDYFSSYSEGWLRHAERYVEEMTGRFGLNGQSQVVEVASNDGYLLQFFARRGVPVLGVEPAENVARIAQGKGIPTEAAFFGLEKALELKRRGYSADLALGNNVLAHVPDINDFVAGFAALLKPDGIMTVEFPHLLNLIRERQFDTIYHEHFSYLSLRTVQSIFARYRLKIFDVQTLPTHGGSLRVFASLEASGRAITVSSAVEALLCQEEEARLHLPEGYADFAAGVMEIKLGLLEFLIRARRENKKVCAYGAAAKGNTLLNFCGVRPDLLAMVADKSPHKQNKFLPGSRIPVVAPEDLLAARPDYVLILPWNLKDEICAQLAAIRNWGGRFVTAVPALRVWE